MGDDSSFLFLLVFWPIFAMIAIIKLNIAYIRNVIHKELKYHYEANNINHDTKRDSGSVTEQEKSYLPTYYLMSTARLKSYFDMQFWGTLDDIGISYKVDKFEYLWTKKDRNNNDSKVFKFKGNALVVDYKDKEPFKEAIVFFNNRFNDESSTVRFFSESQAQFLLETKEEYSVNDEKIGYLNYKQGDILETELTKVRNLIGETSDFFRKKPKLFVIFEGNRVVILTEEKHRFKIKIPLLIRKATIDNLISIQKGNIYRFNILLTKIS